MDIGDQLKMTFRCPHCYNRIGFYFNPKKLWANDKQQQAVGTLCYECNKPVHIEYSVSIRAIGA